MSFFKKIFFAFTKRERITFLAASGVAIVSFFVVISMIVITLFVPCIANLFIIVKEHGWKIALGMAAFIFPFAFLIGGLVRLGAEVLGLSF